MGETADPVETAWQRCSAAHPDVQLNLAQFREHVAARAGDLAVDALCLDDLWLACAGCAGDPGAVRAIERDLIPLIDLALRTWPADVVDETRQRLRATLLVDHAGRGPLLLQYNGRGALSRWIRVVAVREAGRTQRADRAATPVEDELFDALAPPGDPALSAVKNDAAAAFKKAFAAALEELERRDRTVLRLHVLDGLTIDDIAPMFGAHRATVARWIANAKASVLERTRKKLMHDLRLDGADVDSLIRLVQSRIEVPTDALDTTS